MAWCSCGASSHHIDGFPGGLDGFMRLGALAAEFGRRLDRCVGSLDVRGPRMQLGIAVEPDRPQCLPRMAAQLACREVERMIADPRGRVRILRGLEPLVILDLIV